MHWANEFCFCSQNFTFNLRWLVPVSFLMISRYLQLDASCCYFFLYEMWCARVKLHSAHDIVWYILCVCGTVCSILGVDAEFQFNPIRLFFLTFLLNFLSAGIVLLFVRCTRVCSLISENISSLGGFNFSTQWNFFFGLCF